MELKKNQILITISEDKKKLTVECGAFFHPITFDACPNKTIQNIGNAIKTYDEKLYPSVLSFPCVFKSTKYHL